MSTYEAITAKLGDHVVSTLERMQQVQVDALNAIGSVVAHSAPAAQGGVVAPSPREVAEANLALAERLLDAQRTYVFAVLDALSPITEQVSASATTSAKRNSAKAKE